MKQSTIITVAAGLCIGALTVTSLPAAATDDRDESRGGIQMSDQELREKLTPEQYHVTQEKVLGQPPRGHLSRCGLG